MERVTGKLPERGDDLWVKVVGMLQQNWAAIEPEGDGVRVSFIGDTGGVFDQMTFPSEAEAIQGLRRNGFQRFNDEPEMHKFLAPPEPPFRSQPHPNGPIYSSGRFWR